MKVNYVTNVISRKKVAVTTLWYNINKIIFYLYYTIALFFLFFNHNDIRDIVDLNDILSLRLPAKKRNILAFSSRFIMPVGKKKVTLRVNNLKPRHYGTICNILL